MFVPQDKFFKRAKEQGYRARSVFKLEAIDERFRLLRPGLKVLDLGAAPGSFLQYIAPKVGAKGWAVGIDLQPIQGFPQQERIRTFVGDVFDEALMERILQELKFEKFDLITSDMAPKTSGIRFVDGAASLELNLRVLELTTHYLRAGGNAVMKILPGFDEGLLMGPAHDLFRKIKKFRPPAVRGSSGESYIIALDAY